MSNKFRLKTVPEEDKAILTAIANLTGIPKLPSDPATYAKVIIDYYNNIIAAVSPKPENELEEIEQDIELESTELELAVDSFFSKIGKAIKKVFRR